MRNRKVSFSAALIATILTTGAVRGDSTAIIPAVTTSLWTDPGRILDASPAKGGVGATGVGETFSALPAAAGDLDRPPEPASMGFLGLGISGIVALRRIRKLFF